MLGLGLSLPGVAARRRPTADPSITSIVGAGDSITVDASSYARLYSPPSGKTFTVRAQGSRTAAFDAEAGAVATAGDGSNTVLGHVPEDVSTYGGQILPTLIGANDLPAARTVAQFKSDMSTLKAAVEAAGSKLLWSPPLPYDNFDATRHPQYATFTSRRVALLANLRDPAVWGPLCHGFFPLGLCPAFNVADNHAMFGAASGGVHPDAGGHLVLAPYYKPVIDTAFDAPERATSTRMYDEAWPTGAINQLPSTTLTIAIKVSGLPVLGGLALTGGCELKVAGGGNPQLKVATDPGSAYGPSYSGWLYNGDEILVQLDTAATAATDTTIALKIGDETRDLTYRTVASVTPASYVDGGYVSTGPGSGVRTFAGKSFDSGLAIVALDTNGYPASAVKVGDVGLSKLRDDGFMQIWAGVVAAGTHDIETTQASGYIGQMGVLWGTAKNVDPAPVASDAASAADVPPHGTPSLTLPASGLLLGFVNYIGLGDAGAAVSIHSSDTASVMVRQGAVTQTGTTSIIALARRPASGSIAFDNTAGYGGPWRTGLVFKAAGT